jgi:hypothetical protein
VQLEGLNKLGGGETMASSGDRLCGLAVRVSGYSSRRPGSIPGTTRFSEK